MGPRRRRLRSESPRDRREEPRPRATRKCSGVHPRRHRGEGARGADGRACWPTRRRNPHRSSMTRWRRTSVPRLPSCGTFPEDLPDKPRFPAQVTAPVEVHDVVKVARPAALAHRSDLFREELFERVAAHRGGRREPVRKAVVDWPKDGRARHNFRGADIELDLPGLRRAARAGVIDATLGIAAGGFSLEHRSASRELDPRFIVDARQHDLKQRAESVPADRASGEYGEVEVFRER